MTGFDDGLKEAGSQMPKAERGIDEQATNCHTRNMRDISSKKQEDANRARRLRFWTLLSRCMKSCAVNPTSRQPHRQNTSERLTRTLYLEYMYEVPSSCCPTIRSLA
jgi:hypothetical protein